MKKKLPILRTDQEAEHFLETCDLSEYDLSEFKSANFIFFEKPQASSNSTSLTNDPSNS